MPVQPAKPDLQDLPFALSPEEDAELDRRVADARNPNVRKYSLEEMEAFFEEIKAEWRQKRQAKL